MKIYSIVKAYLIVCLIFFSLKTYSQGCIIDPTRSHPQEGDWYYCPNGATLPGFPGSPNAYNLQEVTIRPGQNVNNGYIQLPVIPSNPSPGWSVFLPVARGNNQPLTPCPGDPIKNANLAASNATNYAGGTFGFTRRAGAQFHDGTDISMGPNQPLYSMYDGVVSDTRSSFAPDEYAKKSYGNYVEIKSVIDGETVYLKYNHMNGIGTDMVNGTQVKQGQIIGISGTTGNAADPQVINKHVHIQAQDVNRKKLDPEKYIKTKFDHTTGKGTPPC